MPDRSGPRGRSSLNERARRLSTRLPAPLRRTLSFGLRGIRKLGVVEMERDEETPLPEVVMAEGYRSGRIDPGKERDFIQVIRRSLRPNANEDWFRASVVENPHYSLVDLVMIYRAESPVAAAAAAIIVRSGKSAGLIYSVGVDQEHRGRGLGRAVSLLALRSLEGKGLKTCVLKTHWFRIPALQLYLSLGFEPLIENGWERIKWFCILRRIRRLGRKYRDTPE